MGIEQDAFYRDIERNLKNAIANGTAPFLKDQPAGSIEPQHIPYVKDKEGNPTALILEGINAIHLQCCAANQGFRDSRWMTADSVNEINNSAGKKIMEVKYGAKPTVIAVYDKYIHRTDVNPISGKKWEESKFPNYIMVYNAEQIRGMPERTPIVNDDYISSKQQNVMTNIPDREPTKYVFSMANMNAPENSRFLSSVLSTFELAVRTGQPYQRIVDTLPIQNEVAKMDLTTLLKTTYTADSYVRSVVNPKMEYDRGAIQRTVETDKGRTLSVKVKQRTMESGGIER